MTIQKIALPLVGLTVTTALTFVGITPASAAEIEVPNNQVVCTVETLHNTWADSELLCKIVDISSYLKFGSDGRSLTTTLTDAQLVTDYGFTSAQVADFREILAGTYKPPAPPVGVYAERSARFYISNEDLKAGAFAALAIAAEAGPEALAAAFVGVSSLMGGPVGSIIGGGVALLGTGFFIALALKITGALAQGKGVAFYPQWDFPPLTVAIE
ncbi:hypothetical protein [Canibacter zhoujuaniae]|uniref:hypothetical protein n=1 Tax=Canibacter zhoujuaniae TaxID=2708343 RepID=UPI0014200B90|nr:hypothetical protein [Canibacter zhoujuaniae]